MRKIQIYHGPTNQLLAQGPVGWGIFPLEGNYYIRKKYLTSRIFKPNFVPGICSYKFLYVWLDLVINGKKESKSLAWFYWLPNPLLPFIWFRVAIPRNHPEIVVVESEAD